jgi:hydrogenase maturation protease
MPSILIVAYGNPLRSDDGVAWRAADALEARLPTPEVEILRLHQLAPELAETARHSDYLIFLDAASGSSGLPGEIRVEEIQHLERTDRSRFSHVIAPQDVISLVRTLYAATPKAILITVIGASFEHGESLSPAVEAALPVLVDHVAGIVQSFQTKKPQTPKDAK